MEVSRGLWQAIQLDATKNPKHGTVIAEAASHGSRCPPAIRDLWKAGEVCICWSYAAPIRKLSTEGLASVRQKRLRRRLDAKVPLLAEQLYAVGLSRLV